MYVYRIDVLKTKSVKGYDEPGLNPVDDGSVHIAKYFHTLDALNKYLKEAAESLQSCAVADAKLARLQYGDDWIDTNYSDADKECSDVEESSFDGYTTSMTKFAISVWCCDPRSSYSEWEINYNITVERISTED